jgi:hypothetical protein
MTEGFSPCFLGRQEDIPRKGVGAGKKSIYWFMYNFASPLSLSSTIPSKQKQINLMPQTDSWNVDGMARTATAIATYQMILVERVSGSFSKGF